MLRLVIAGSLLIASLAIYDVSNAQLRNIAPYLGASGSLGDGYGWGIEGGSRFFPFYAGLEYGVYYQWPPDPSSASRPIGQIPPPFAISSVQYGGIHAGYVMSDSTFIGIVVLRNYQQWETLTSLEEGVISTKVFWDFGLDIRYTRINNGHMYFALALTYKRGLKLGLGYIF